jgi:hypothetical protein
LDRAVYTGRAEDFPLQPYRERRMTSAQLASRLSALEALAAGEVGPRLPTLRQRDSQIMTQLADGKPLSRKPHPPFHPENLGDFPRPHTPKVNCNTNSLK